MNAGYTKEQVDRVLATLRDSMRSLVARVVATYDNELALAQRTVQATYSGWDAKDVPANVTLLLRDFAIRRDTKVDAEIYRITSTFEMVEKLVMEASGYEEAPVSPEDVDEPDAFCEAGDEADDSDARYGEVQETSIQRKILDVLRASVDAKSLDDLIVECYAESDRVDRSEFSSALRVLQETGSLIEVDPDTYAVA
jgi:hypothetical protein